MTKAWTKACSTHKLAVVTSSDQPIAVTLFGELSGTGDSGAKMRSDGSVGVLSAVRPP